MESSLQFHRGASCLLVAPFIGIRIPPIGFPRSCDTWIFYKGISGAITVSDVIRQVFQLVRKSVCKERSGLGRTDGCASRSQCFEFLSGRCVYPLTENKDGKILVSFILSIIFLIFNLFKRALLKISNSPNPFQNLIATLVTNLNCSWKFINQRGNVS